MVQPVCNVEDLVIGAKMETLGTFNHILLTTIPRHRGSMLFSFMQLFKTKICFVAFHALNYMAVPVVDQKSL